MEFRVGDYVRYDGEMGEDVHFGEVVGVVNMTVHVRFDTFDYSSDGEDDLEDFHYMAAKDLTVVERPETSFGAKVDTVLEDVREILLAKNAAYGNSALNPVRIFSKADTAEQLRVRVDDKLSRLARGHEYEDEDTVMDLIGYLCLLRIAESREG